ncbi:hypothetical protein WMF45_34705 [Sorangium sp. So ce448]|uniref:hypothetical protein n=1 Tax=Sorangium sp. So ce448 TaxID=3133314 RepID=UPI003F604D5E
MAKRVLLHLAAIGITAAWGSLTVPGCTIRFGPGTGDETDHGTPGTADGDESGGTATEGEPEEPATEEDPTEQPFEGIDPEELALASAKASLATYYFAGTVDALGIDPATLDEATWRQLMEQYMPLAEAEAEQWLSTMDPSTLPLVKNEPRWECKEQWSCAYVAKCWNPPYVNLNHNCWVNDCGDARCRACPDWFPDFFKNLVMHSWCSYVCVEPVAYGKVVAVGAGGVSALGRAPIPPFCMEPPPL